MCAHYIGLVDERVKALIQAIETTPAEELPHFEQRELELTDSQGETRPGTHLFPKSAATLIAPTFDTAEGVPALAQGTLQAQPLTWGFQVPWTRQPVFNTRIESVDKPVWRKVMEHDRCIIPALGFYESSKTETAISPRTGKTIKQQYRFTVPGMPIIFIGAVRREGQFSMVTTDANPIMAPIHNRMPLILHPTELNMWLGPNYLALADRARVPLDPQKVEER